VESDKQQVEVDTKLRFHSLPLLLQLSMGMDEAKEEVSVANRCEETL
jgi:hypothetical protein